MKLYKLTNPDGITRPRYNNALQWGEGVTHRATGRGGICTSGVIHAYETPELAAFMDPAHTKYGDNALLWEAEGEVIHRGGTKVGCIQLTTLQIIELPILTIEQRVEIAIRAAMVAGGINETWNNWADAWLANTDRTEASAWRVKKIMKALSEATWIWSEATWIWSATEAVVAAWALKTTPVWASQTAAVAGESVTETVVNFNLTAVIQQVISKGNKK